MNEESICECGGALIGELKPEHHFSFLGGISLMLLSSATEFICDKCGEIEYEIPDMDGLIAAVALTRIKMSEKLKGSEISFLRKAVNLPANKFSKHLDVTPETLSRWENDKKPMAPLAERVLRLLVGLELESKAPAIDFDLKEIGLMDFKGIYKKTTLIFERVKYKEKSQASEETYAEAASG